MTYSPFKVLVWQKTFAFGHHLCFLFNYPCTLEILGELHLLIWRTKVPFLYRVLFFSSSVWSTISPKQHHLFHNMVSTYITDISYIVPHCSKSPFFVQKFNFDFPRKNVELFRVKTRENAAVLNFLPVDNFDFTRKIV